MEIQRLRDLWEDHDKTQQEVTAYLNMNRSIYRRYENGSREIQVWVLDKMADYYQVSTDYLLGRTDIPTQPKRSRRLQLT